MKNLDKILNIATKIKTPLSIAGLVVITLYLIVRQILNLNVFSNVGQDKSYLLLSKILDKIFLLALIALVLGIFSYLFTLIVKKKMQKKSDIRILDASNDENLSDYKEISNAKGKKIIKPNDKN